MLDLIKQLKLRNLSLEEAAKKSGISIERLKDIAKGKDFSLHELRLLSKSLHIPLSYLGATPSQESEIEILFRKSLNRDLAEDKPIIDSLARELANLIDLARALPSSIGWIQLLREAAKNSDDTEKLSNSFRALFCADDQEGPLTKLPNIVSETIGINLIIVPDLQVEGASVLYNEQAFIFLAPRRFKPRMLFTLAHEVGHFVAQHHGKINEFATFDSEEELSPWKPGSRKNEEIANQFASALLMPAHSVGLVLKNIRKNYKISGELGDIEISYLARFFGVSFEVAARRCEMLELLPRYGGRTIYEMVCEKYTNPERRADELGLPARVGIEFEPPRRLIQVASKKVRSGEISSGRAIETLHVRLSDLFRINAESNG